MGQFCPVGWGWLLPEIIPLELDQFSAEGNP